MRDIGQLILLVVAGMEALAIGWADGDLFALSVTDDSFLSTAITVAHSCRGSQLLCSQVSVLRQSSSVVQFQQPLCQDCALLPVGETRERLQQSIVPIGMQDEFQCSPDYWNPDPIFISSARLYLYILQKHGHQFLSESDYSQIHRNSIKKIVYELVVPPPYSRRKCLKWRDKSATFLHLIDHWRFSGWQSPLVQSPYVLSSGLLPSHGSLGLYLMISDESDNRYFTRFIKHHTQKFTFSLWIYLSSPCTKAYCNVISFFTDHDEHFSSPVVLLMNSGEFHIQVKNRLSLSDVAFRTMFKTPLRVWFQLIMSFNTKKWSATIFSINGTNLGETNDTRFAERIKLDIINDFGIVGGSQVYVGIQGYFTDIYLYRGIFGRHKQIHESKKFTGSSHHILHEHRLNTCRNLLNELESYMILIQRRLTRQFSNASCPRYSFLIRHENKEQCFVRRRDLKRPKIYSFIKRSILKDTHALKTLKIIRNFNLEKTIIKESYLFTEIIEALKEHMFMKVEEQLKKKGIRVTAVIRNYLHDCSCLGDPNAAYILSACYFYGVGEIKINVTKAYELLMINVESHLHRLSLLALGNIHYQKLIPGTGSLASVYYKAVADYTPKDIEDIDNKDMFNDQIRLTNEAAVKEHTDEDGDLFQWIKHQASSGLPWAKQRLGRMFYWGGQGIRRNVNMALNFFRMAAEAPDAQAGDHFDYGLLLVKKSQKNEDIMKGKAQLEKASEKDPRALTVLGWMAEVHEKNNSKAFEYYKKAYKLRNPDSTFNLGVFYHYGKPNLIKQNKKEAFKYFQESAVLYHLSGGVMYSHYLLSGIKGFLPKNLSVAVNWARYVGERNPKIGYYLSEGVRAYRKRNMHLSMFYYLMAAYSGLELANFNIALLCDEQEVIAKKYIQRECTWYHFNLSIQREENQINAYSLIKMGDKNWYGCSDADRNINKSIEFYIRAAKKREPQAYFNLAFILENDHSHIPTTELQKIIPLPNITRHQPEEWRHNVILALYQRCEIFSERDNYLPCRLASQRIKAVRLWANAKTKIQLLIIVAVTGLMLYKVVSLWRGSGEVSLPCPDP